MLDEEDRVDAPETENAGGGTPVTPTVETVPGEPEDATAVMTAHFRVHPENRVSDVAAVVNVLIPWVTTSEARRRIVRDALEASQHPLLEEMDAVLATL